MAARVADAIVTVMAILALVGGFLSFAYTGINALMFVGAAGATMAIIQSLARLELVRNILKSRLADLTL